MLWGALDSMWLALHSLVLSSRMARSAHWYSQRRWARSHSWYSRCHWLALHSRYSRSDGSLRHWVLSGLARSAYGALSVDGSLDSWYSQCMARSVYEVLSSSWLAPPQGYSQFIWLASCYVVLSSALARSDLKVLSDCMARSAHKVLSELWLKARVSPGTRSVCCGLTKWTCPRCSMT